MLRANLQNRIDSIRDGLNAGFVAGIIILFLILIGVPIRIENLAVILFLLTLFVFGSRLARQLKDENITRLIMNALAMGVTASVMVLALLALVNSWQAKGIDVKQYLDAVDTGTINVLSGIPVEELHSNPEIDPMTGTYVEGEPLRTSPMTLTFDTSRAIHLKLGMTGESLFDINLGIGGIYGFLVTLIIAGGLGAGLTRAWMAAKLGRYRQQASTQLSDNPIVHWIVIFLPVIFFALLWISLPQGGSGPILSLGDSTQQIMLLNGFLIILWALVSIRTAGMNDWGLTYTMRVAGAIAAIVAMLGLGVIRIITNDTYFIAPPDTPGGSETLSILALAVVGVILAVQSVRSLRQPGRFEKQVAANLALSTLVIMPLYLDQYQSDVMTLVGINILLGLGLNIVVGYAGLLDLGYVAFFALGAYTYAFLSSQQQIMNEENQPAGLKFEGNAEAVIRVAAWTTTTIILATLVIAAGLYLWRRRQQPLTTRAAGQRTLIDTPSRPRAGYATLLTIAAIIISVTGAALFSSTALYDDLFNGASPFLVGLLTGVLVSGISGIMLGIPVLRLRGDYLAIVTLGFGEIIRLLFTNLRDLTGGPQGIVQIPRPLPDDASGTATYLAILYLVMLGAALVAFFSARLKSSRTGRAWSAMRSDEDIAQSMGVNLVQSKLTAFAIGAAFAGIGGVLFAARQRNIFPADFKLDVSIEVLSLVIIGGMGSIPGVIMGAIVLIGIPEVLRELATYRILAFGALLVTMVIIRPKGLLPEPPAQLASRARQLAAQYGLHKPETEDSQS